MLLLGNVLDQGDFELSATFVDFDGSDLHEVDSSLNCSDNEAYNDKDGDGVRKITVAFSTVAVDDVYKSTLLCY